jgi:hypothetical protein
MNASAVQQKSMFAYLLDVPHHTAAVKRASVGQAAKD